MLGGKSGSEAAKAALKPTFTAAAGMPDATAPEAAQFQLCRTQPSVSQNNPQVA